MEHPLAALVYMFTLKGSWYRLLLSIDSLSSIAIFWAEEEEERTQKRSVRGSGSDPLTTHLYVVVDALVDGQTVLVQTVWQCAQDVRVSCLLVSTDDHHDHKDQKHDNGHKDCHNHTHVVVLRVLVYGSGGDHWTRGQEKDMFLLKKRGQSKYQRQWYSPLGT